MNDSSDMAAARANAAVAGALVHVVGAVGAHDHGRGALAEPVAERVDVSGVPVLNDEATGVASQIQRTFQIPVDHTTTMMLLSDYFIDLELDGSPVRSPPAVARGTPRERRTSP